MERNHLSIGGKEILLKVVARAIPVHEMLVFICLLRTLLPEKKEAWGLGNFPLSNYLAVVAKKV